MAPIYVNIDDKTYIAGVNLGGPEFYQLQRASKKLPTTSQTTAEDFLKIFTKLADEAEEIVTITISSKMSATIQSAEMAKKQFTKVPVHIIDSESVSLGQGMMAIAAAQAAKEGQDAESVIHLVEEIKKRMNVIFTVRTLEYLYKGGRIGGATAFLGSALAIKPILYIKDGVIEPLEKQYTRKKSIMRLVEIMKERIGDKPVHVAILHGDAEEEAYVLENQIREKFNYVQLIKAEIGPVIGVHAGPGTLGLVFYSME
jgi:DegV family protein with EDD domain